MTRIRSASAAVATLTALTIAIAGCTAAPAPDEPDGPDAPTYQARETGELQEVVETMALEMGVPGAVMLLRTPDGEQTVTYGVTELGGDVPVTTDQHIRIGSNTKTMTGTVILQLAQEGALSLDDAVSTYRPEVPGGDDIAIAQLLNMRSGLFNYTETYELNAALDAEPGKAWDPEDLVAMGLALPPYFAPGEGYHYSNTNTVLLGLIAEQIEGAPLEQILAERLFEPFGLDQTLLPARDVNTLPEPFSRGYMYTDNVMTMSVAALPADLQAAAQEGSLLPNDQTLVNPSWGWAAGAGISTAEDLADWAEVLGTGAALDAETHQARLDSLEPTSDAADAPRYGYALAQLGPFLGHTGELPGYNAFMGHEPDAGVTLVVWANLAPTAAGQDPATTMARALIGELYPAD
ncbi:beta-lactamase family protein [Microbacterium sp. LRZ72]|uniref:serine hydrolase domain-containing protein n=1 Tax=Microbacterium sp. LRZ72 TaxID=2942481 RepID=UPI0029BCB406|nr:serine hydrolase domain-containing protein [Microbacterium sp. LRZ72]MDX2376448.1 beta-lactamase family protein [Microbacterium sp. LRZ72]